MDRDGGSRASWLIMLIAGIGGGLWCVAIVLLVAEASDLIEAQAKYSQKTVLLVAGLVFFVAAALVKFLLHRD